jgi:hypothetical protein
MEIKRVQISLPMLIHWYGQLEEALRNIPRYFIFNMDETGVDDWVDSHDVLVAIPREFRNSETSIPIARRSKRATLTGCIGADGSALKPLLIMSTGSIIEDVEEAGFTADKVLFIYQNHGFMTKLIFKYWCKEIFFPEIKSRRTKFNYEGTTILLMDQFSGHDYPGFAEDCESNGVQARPLILHTSHLAQPLEQIIFSEFKRRFSSIRFSKFLTTGSNRLIRILKAWFQTITADLITSTFTAAGIIPERSPQRGFYCCKVDLQRSIHMKDIKTDTTRDDVSKVDIPPYEGGGIPAPQFCFGSSHSASSAPPSAIKKPQKRIPIVKLETKTPEKKSEKPTSNSLAIQPSHSKPPIDFSSHRQLTMIKMLQTKTKKHPESTESMLLPTTKEIAEKFTSK